MFAHIARQPIFDAQNEIVGYELLYRGSGKGNKANVRDASAATRSVLSDALTVFGMETLGQGSRLFIIFTRELLLDDFPRLAPARDIVVEIPQSVRLDDQLIEKLRKLQKDGYVLALNNYTGDERYDNLLPLFNIIKVDFRATTGVELKMMKHTLAASRAHLMACKLESGEEYETAKKMGFHFFEGYCLGKPVRFSKQVPTLASWSYGMLMSELAKPTVDFDTCSKVIESDVVLTYMLLRQVQTANYYRGNVISDIKRAVVMMGTDELRRWIWVVLARQNSVAHSDGLARQAYLRGRFIEGLIKNADLAPPKNEGFLLGMFSLLDRVMGVRMDELLHGLNLSEDVKAALLGEQENQYSDYLQYVMIYEMGDERLWFPDIHLRLNQEQVNELYQKCAAETEAVFKSVGGRKK